MNKEIFIKLHTGGSPRFIRISSLSNMTRDGATIASVDGVFTRFDESVETILAMIDRAQND